MDDMEFLLLIVIQMARRLTFKTIRIALAYPLTKFSFEDKVSYSC